MDNALKRSFPIHLKEEKEKGCGCGCNDQAEELREAFSQDEGVTSFLKEQKNPFVNEQDDEQLSDVDVEEGKMSDILGVPEDEDISDAYDGSPEDAAQEVVDAVGEDEAASMINYAANISGDSFLKDMQDALKNIGESVSRGAVEEVLAELNGDHQTTETTGQDRGAVEDVLRSLNGGETDGYGVNLGEGEVPDELEDNQFGSDEEEEEEEEMDEVVASVLDELNEKSEEDPCWDGYTQVGMKQGENGEEVPNCVPDDEVDDAEGYEESVGGDIDGDALLDSVLEDQVNELTQLDRLAEEVLNG